MHPEDDELRGSLQREKMLRVEQAGESEWVKIVKELLKKRHLPPKTLFPDRYTVDDDDEAYYYWERSGILWKDPKMEKWLAQNTEKRKSR